MVSKLFPLVMVLILTLTLMTGCRRDETVTDTAYTDTATDTAWTATATDTAWTATDTGTAGFGGMGDTGPGAEWVSSVRLGKELNQEGGVPLGSASSSFRVGEPIHVAMEIDQRPPQGQVRVVWYGPTNQQIGEDSREVQANTIVNFRAPAQINQPGEYRVDVMADGALVKTERFTVER
jgi:hypothetical protein